MNHTHLNSVLAGNYVIVIASNVFTRKVKINMFAESRVFLLAQLLSQWIPTSKALFPLPSHTWHSPRERDVNGANKQVLDDWDRLLQCCVCVLLTFNIQTCSFKQQIPSVSKNAHVLVFFNILDILAKTPTCQQFRHWSVVFFGPRFSIMKKLAWLNVHLHLHHHHQHCDLKGAMSLYTTSLNGNLHTIDSIYSLPSWFSWISVPRSIWSATSWH